MFFGKKKFLIKIPSGGSGVASGATVTVVLGPTHCTLPTPAIMYMYRGISFQQQVKRWESKVPMPESHDDDDGGDGGDND